MARITPSAVGERQMFPSTRTAPWWSRTTDTTSRPVPPGRGLTGGALPRLRGIPSWTAGTAARSCGHDPMADFAVPDEPASSKRARRSDKAAKAEKPAKAPEPTTAPKAVTAPRPPRAESLGRRRRCRRPPAPAPAPDHGTRAGHSPRRLPIVGEDMVQRLLGRRRGPPATPGLARPRPMRSSTRSPRPRQPRTLLATASAAPVIGGPAAGGPRRSLVAIGASAPPRSRCRVAPGRVPAGSWSRRWVASAR